MTVPQIVISMQRQKPARLEARQFKNSLISSRNQSQSPQVSVFSQLLTSTAKFAEPTTPQEPQPTPARRQNTVASSSSVDNNPSSHKRLKLKDYIHLNGLQKRHKSKSNNSSFSEQRIKTEDKATTEATIDLEKLKTTNIEIPTQIEPSHKKSPQENYSMMIKQEIAAKIQEERKRLTDLESYLDSDFKCKPDATETFVFLFSVYNKLTDIHKTNEDIGARIIEYHKVEEPQITSPPKKSSMKTPRITKKISYHWEEDNRELDSPAKIMNNALKLTFDLTKLLNITK